MLTLEQLRDTKVDFDIATEALAQSEKRLDDAFDDYCVFRGIVSTDFTAS